MKSHLFLALSPPRADFTSPSSVLPESWVEEMENSVSGDQNTAHVCLRLRYPDMAPSTRSCTCSLLSPGERALLCPRARSPCDLQAGTRSQVCVSSQFPLKWEQLFHCRPTSRSEEAPRAAGPSRSKQVTAFTASPRYFPSLPTPFLGFSVAVLISSRKHH